MNKGQFWILEVLLEYGCSLPLIDPSCIAWHFDSSHGLDRQQLAQTLEELIARGDIRLERETPGEPQSVVFLPARSELETLLLGAPREHDELGKGDELGEYTDIISLTAQGGQRWEDVAAPDWNRYVSSDRSGHLRPEWEEAGWEVTSTDRRLVERYLALPEVQACFVPGSEVWDSPAPWEATYWKMLPRGHRVTFRLRTLEDEELEDGELAIIPYIAPEPWCADPFVSNPPQTGASGREWD